MKNSSPVSTPMATGTVQIDRRIHACRPKTVSIERWQPNVRHALHQTRSRIHNLANLGILHKSIEIRQFTKRRQKDLFDISTGLAISESRMTEAKDWS